MAIRTQEELKLYLQLDKEKRLKKQQLEKDRKKKIKVQERRNKQKHKQHLAKLEKQAQKALNKPQNVSRVLNIYNVTNLIGRAPSDEELYLTREELQEAEKRGEGKIRWDVFDKLVKEGRKK